MNSYLDKADFYLVTGFSMFLVFNLTKNTYSMMNRLELLECNMANLKERISDLELFKLKIYNNEIIPGRRAWDDIDIDMDIDEEVD